MRQIVRKSLLAPAVTAAVATGALAPQLPAFAQAKEQFFPILVYRTGAYAPNGVPFANGMVDYLKMINARDGGVNGIKMTFEECETGYATDRGVECYERLKGKGPTGATAVHPLSTGITFALTDKAPTDKIPIITMGYGRSESAEGRVFKYNFPIGGTYWTAADILVQHVGKKEGGLDKLKGKKIALIYHDSPYGKEPIPLLVERAKMHGFDLQQIAVTHPGVEQKAAWLQVRQSKPDYVFLWGWGVMNSTALKEAVATGFPRDKMYGVWWAAAEPDVIPAGEGSKGYQGLNFLAGAGLGKAHQDILKLVHEKGQGTGPKEEVGTVLYNRGMVAAAINVEAVRKAQEKHGKKPLTGAEAQWGFENLAIDAARIKAIGFEGYMTPLSTSCADHMGGNQARVHQWDGKKWNYVSEVLAADMQIIKPMVDAAAKKYATEKKLDYRDCAKDAG
jgi:branched-chain amino acid transport system substrate-binding protein